MSSHPKPLLLVNGAEYDAWEQVSISTGMEQQCGAFGADVVQDAASEYVDFTAGTECEVQIDGHILITGTVDTISRSYDSGGERLSVSGRDILGDLVDCAHLGPPNEWRRASVESIVSVLCQPFGIEVVAEVSTGKPIERFTYQPGESVMESVSKILKTRGLLPVSYGDGKLYLTNSGAATRATNKLVYGHNILAASLNRSMMEQFSRYTVKGQDIGGDGKTLAAFSSPKSTVQDTSVTRYRPLVIVADGPVDAGYCRARATWEAANRAARARVYEATVQGWLQTDGAPWRINSIVEVEDRRLGFYEELLISAVNFTRSMSGTFTQLTCVHLDAYTAEPVNATESGDGSFKMLE